MNRLLFYGPLLIFKKLDLLIQIFFLLLLCGKYSLKVAKLVTVSSDCHLFTVFFVSVLDFISFFKSANNTQLSMMSLKFSQINWKWCKWCGCCKQEDGPQIKFCFRLHITALQHLNGPFQNFNECLYVDSPKLFAGTLSDSPALESRGFLQTNKHISHYGWITTVTICKIIGFYRVWGRLDFLTTGFHIMVIPLCFTNSTNWYFNHKHHYNLLQIDRQ